MSAAIEISAFDALPPRDRLLAAVLDQLEPMFAMLYDGDLAMGRGAAMDAMEPYVQDERADLATAGQIVACGLASMRVLQLCMKPETTATDLARLTRTVDTLSRTEHRHRTTGLYPPAEPKPAAPKRASAVRAAPTPIVEETSTKVTAEPQPKEPEPKPQTTKDHRQIAAATKAGHLDGILSAKVSDANRSVRDHILGSSALNGSMAPRHT